MTTVNFNYFNPEHQSEILSQLIELHDKYSKFSINNFADVDTLQEAIDNGFSVDNYFEFQLHTTSDDGYVENCDLVIKPKF